MDMLHQARKTALAPREADWAFQRALLTHLESIWCEPDEGIWEFRGGVRHFTFSKVMSWVAFDRGIKAIEGFGLEGPLSRWRAVRRAIHEDVCAKGYDAGIGSFVQSYGSRELDASLLLIPTTGFLPPDDPRVRSTVEAIERRLVVDGLVLRYDTASAEDGLPAGEGAFLACSFWLADAYALLGRLEEAQRLFEHLLTLRNDVGLLSEQYDPRAGRLVGNFPQAFSHIALIDTAHNLTRATRPAEQRAEG
jgi:GH15 family glucan-1,4-alpha-glucosidase